MWALPLGFDEFQGYCASQKELTQQFDARRYPDLVLDEEQFAEADQILADFTLRVREYKMHLQVMQMQNAFQNIDYTTTSKVGLSPWLASIAAEAKEHAGTFKKHPPKKIRL
ncbi:hypothetical protein ACLHDG_05220 [Sulfurovum sp. CS9]|uniref:hypothetical protein n=1 Tax=Sulfurovum sp. CS9 TaxID=3391146 RepID=UPI0039EB968D